MSFSSNVKDELEKHLPKARHCQLAEAAGLYAFGATSSTKLFTILKKTFNIDKVANETDFVKIADDLRVSLDGTVDGTVIQQSCCKRAFIRGAFLAAGSISDPEKSYHFEIVCKNEAQASLLMEVLNAFGLNPKCVSRKGKMVCYIKEGDQIVDVMRIMEASMAVMNLENARILREKRGDVNRLVNCETANLMKTVNAAVRQTKDIEFIDRTVGLASLPEELIQVAEIRLANPDMPLKDIGQLLDPPLGKSGVNHRLKRISEFADKLR